MTRSDRCCRFAALKPPKCPRRDGVVVANGPIAQFVGFERSRRRIINVIIQDLVAIFASIVGLLSSLTSLVMLMAGMANSKPEQLVQGKWMMWGIVALQVVALGAAIWLMLKHKPWYATAAGVFPLVAVVVLVVVLVKIEW